MTNEEAVNKLLECAYGYNAAAYMYATTNYPVVIAMLALEGVRSVKLPTAEMFVGIAQHPTLTHHTKENIVVSREEGCICFTMYGVTISYMKEK